MKENTKSFDESREFAFIMGVVLGSVLTLAALSVKGCGGTSRQYIDEDVPTAAENYER